MSKKDAHAIIGRLMEEYGAAKHQVNLHQQSLKEIGDRCEPLPWLLRRGQTDGLLELLKSIDFEAVRVTAENLKVARETAERLTEELRGCGVNL